MSFNHTTPEQQIQQSLKAIELRISKIESKMEGMVYFEENASVANDKVSESKENAKTKLTNCILKWSFTALLAFVIYKAVKS